MKRILPFVLFSFILNVRADYRTDVLSRVRALGAQMPAIVAAAEAARDHINAHPNAGLEISRMECCATHYELAGRAGGLVQVGDVSKRPDGVVLFTVRSWDDFGARAAYLVDGWRRMGKLVILIGAKNGMPTDVKPDFFIDNGAASGAKGTGRVNVLVNTAIAWTWVCEYAAAFTKDGHFPAIYRSIATADSFGVLAQNRSSDLAHRFHPCAERIPSGKLGGIYLNQLEKRLVDLSEPVVQEGIEKAARHVVKALASGKRVGAVPIGHLIMDEVRDPSAPIFGFRWYTIPDTLFAALDEGDTLIYYGYAGMGEDSWNYMKPIREGKLDLIAVYAPEPQSSSAENPVAFIPEMWKLPDAEVAIPVMPYTMGPQSEFDRVVIQRSLEARVNELLAEQGVKVAKPRAAFEEEYHDQTYRRGWPREDSTFFAERAPDPDDRWGKLDVQGRPVGAPVPRDPFVTEKVESARFGYRRFSVQGDVTFVSSNDLWGVADANGKLIVPIRYVSVERLSDNLFGVNRGGRFGVVDRSDRVVLPFEWDMLDKRRGLGKFLPDGSFKFAKFDPATGRALSEPIYDTYRHDHPIKMPDRKPHPTTKPVKMDLPFAYTYITPEEEGGFHYVAVGGEWREDVYREMPTIYGAKWGAVSKDGKVLVEPKYDGLVRDGDGWRYVIRKRLTRQTP